MLLHAALPCGGARVVYWPTECEGLADALCCGNAACRPPPRATPPTTSRTRSAGAAGLAPTGAAAWPLETLLHALLECPPVHRALGWLAGVFWPRASGGGLPPPLTAEVWLLASPAAAWQPSAPQHDGSSTEEVWSVLRLTALEAIWRLRCRRAATGQQFAATDVMVATVTGLSRVLRSEFHAAAGPPATGVAAVAGTCPSWFPRRNPRASLEVFQAKWCRGGWMAAAGRAAAPPHAPWLDVRLRARVLQLGRAAADATGSAAAPADAST